MLIYIYISTNIEKKIIQVLTKWLVLSDLFIYLGLDIVWLISLSLYLASGLFLVWCFYDCLINLNLSLALLVSTLYCMEFT